MIKAQDTVIRVGEKNNFNMTSPELAELEKYKDKGKIFVNSNSFVPIDPTYPSIITINPHMKFNALKGDLSNVKAVRIKVFFTGIPEYDYEQTDCIRFCIDNNLPILLTYMRYWKTTTATTYSGMSFRNWYKFSKGYHRPTKETKTKLKEWVFSEVEYFGGDLSLIHECDSKGGGCPDCMNCSILTYGKKDATIKALNLSISGKNDRYGRKGECIFDCPDCFAKRVTMGKRPQCDKLITNRKIRGELKNI